MNNSLFTDEEISLIEKKIEKNQCNECISRRQIINIAKKLNEYNFSNDKEKLLSLEYVSKIRGIVLFYINFEVPFNQRNNYVKKYYNTIDYAIKIVINIICSDLNNISVSMDEKLKNKIDFELLELNEKVKKEQIINKKVIKLTIK